MALSRLALFLFMLAAASVSAQTQYVSDELVITLRTGPSIQNAIIRNLTSGDAMQILERNADGSYARVRVQGSGTEGWVLTQYLTSERVARDLLAVATRDLANARERVSELEAQLSAVTSDLEQTRQQLGQTETANNRIGTELADIREASANAIAIRERNESLLRRVNELTGDLDRATMANSELASRSRQNWFVVGAAVLFGGVVIGLIAPSLRRRRTTNW
jgi:SH3 domain protein